MPVCHLRRGLLPALLYLPLMLSTGLATEAAAQTTGTTNCSNTTSPAFKRRRQL